MFHSFLKLFLICILQSVIFMGDPPRGSQTISVAAYTECFLSWHVTLGQYVIQFDIWLGPERDPMKMCKLLDARTDHFDRLLLDTVPPNEQNSVILFISPDNRNHRQPFPGLT